MVAASVAGLSIATASLAAPGEPATAALGDNQPLITLRFESDQLSSLSLGAIGQAMDASAASTAICLVNFTHSKHLIGGHAFVTWFGGIGCNRSMVLFGQAFLQESATTIDAFGNYYENVKSSDASGHTNTVINKPHPSLYIRHLTNIFFPNHPSGGAIGVIPAPGQHLNSASKCSASRTVKYGIGVHCDLYTDRF